MAKSSCMKDGGKVHPMKKGGVAKKPKADMAMGAPMDAGAMGGMGGGAMPPMKKMRRGGMARGR